MTRNRSVRGFALKDTSCKKAIRSFGAAIWLACIVLVWIPVIAAGSPTSVGLVFCPLQRQWVSKAPEPTAQQFDISSYCMPGAIKAAFLRAVSRRAGAGGFKVASSGDFFLKFAAIGEEAFSQHSPPPQTPAPGSAERPGANAAAGETRPRNVFVGTSDLSYRTPLFLSAAAVENCLRTTNFSCPDAHPVSFVPRGPPVSL